MNGVVIDGTCQWCGNAPATVSQMCAPCWDHALDIEDSELECHCGAPLRFGYDDDPTHHRGMCAHCDSVRCDAYPGECGR